MHKMGNVSDKIPESHKADVKTFLTEVRDAPDHASGCLRAKELVNQYKKDFPRAMKSFEDDLEAKLAYPIQVEKEELNL